MPDSFCAAWTIYGGKKIELIIGLTEKGQATIDAPGSPDNEVLATARSGEEQCSVSIQAVLNPILREIFLKSNLVLLHSAGVVHPNGDGVLIIGESGGGKSTTALSLLRQGAKLLGDDLMAVKVYRDCVKGYAIHEPMNLTLTTLEYFPELRLRTIPFAGWCASHKKIVFPEDTYGLECLTDQADIKAIYFIKITPSGPPRLRPFPVAEALSRIFSSHTFSPGQKLTEGAFSQLADLLSRVQLLEIETGNSPQRLGEWLIRIIGNGAGYAKSGDA